MAVTGYNVDVGLMSHKVKEFVTVLRQAQNVLVVGRIDEREGLSLTFSLINQKFIMVSGFLRKRKETVGFNHINLTMKQIF